MLEALLLSPKNIKLIETETPKPKKGEVLVKVKAALTCGTDLKAFLRGHPMIPMPGPFGHEFSGVITAVGKGVKKFSTGDEVMAVHSAPCLGCAYCKKKLYNLCENIMETKALGAFSEYIILPQNVVRINLFKKPEGLSFEEAAFLEPLSCVVHSVEPLGIKRNDSALVMGAGPIGLLHLMLLKSKKANVAVSDINKMRLKSAKALGADFIFNPDKSSKWGGIASFDYRGIAPFDYEGNAPFDYVFECTGVPAVWESSINHLGRGGTLVLFGGCKKGTKVTYDTYRIHYDEITLKGVFHFTHEDVRKAYGLLKERKLNVSALISGRHHLKDIGTAFGKLSGGKGIKYAIVP